METLQELTKSHNTNLFGNTSEDLTKEQATELVAKAMTETSFIKTFDLVDHVINKYDDIISDLELKQELIKFEPILRLIKGINKSHKLTQDELNELYDNAVEFMNEKNTNKITFVKYYKKNVELIKDEWDNTERRRYYGLRKGDIVKAFHLNGKDFFLSEVVEYGSDNNRVIIKLEDGKETDWVAEWCQIVTKVEDK